MILKRSSILYDFSENFKKAQYFGIYLMKSMIFGALITVYIPAYAKAIKSPECSPSEKMIFKCLVKTRTALVCESKGPSDEFLYRYVWSGGAQFDLTTVNSPTNSFRLASHPTPGGSVAYIHFSNRGLDYYLIDYSSRNFDESFSPTSKVFVINGKNIVKNLVCENDDSGINKNAYENMLGERYALPSPKSLALHDTLPR